MMQAEIKDIKEPKLGFWNKFITRIEATYLIFTKKEFFVIAPKNEDFTQAQRISFLKSNSIYNIKAIVDEDIRFLEAEREIKSYLN